MSILNVRGFKGKHLNIYVYCYGPIKINFLLSVPCEHEPFRIDCRNSGENIKNGRRGRRHDAKVREWIKGRWFEAIFYFRWKTFRRKSFLNFGVTNIRWWTPIHRRTQFAFSTSYIMHVPAATFTRIVIVIILIA